jgi:predicted DsbA family dithiol-disulfide isomerase
MQVEIWSDVVCPWCYIGKRRFEAALARFAHRDEVDIVWRSFELDPRAPAVRGGEMAGHLARKYGTSRERAEGAVANLTEQAAADGLQFRLDIAAGGNTFDAHRVLHLAAERGLQDGVKERFLAGYFTEGVAIGLPEHLTRLAVEAGLDQGEVETVLKGDRYAEEVRADEAEARELEISGVPCFVIDRRFMVPGAQDPDTMLRVLDRAWERTGKN